MQLNNDGYHIGREGASPDFLIGENLFQPKGCLPSWATLVGPHTEEGEAMDVILTSVQ